MESASIRTKKHASEQRASAVLLALTAGALAVGCQKSAADNPPGAGAPALPVHVRIAPSVKIPDTTEYLSILKSRHSATANRPPEAGGHRQQPGGLAGRAGSERAVREGFSGARPEAIGRRSDQQAGIRQCANRL